MPTIKMIPALMLAASLGAGTILVSEAALARNNGQHEQHNDHEGSSGMKSGKSDRSNAQQSKVGANSSNKSKGGGFVVTHGGKPPRGDKKRDLLINHGFVQPKYSKPSTKPLTEKPPATTTTSTTKPPTTAPASNAGLPANAAVVSNGTRPDGQTVTGTLGEIDTLIDGLASPALLVVGDVVGVGAELAQRVDANRIATP